jgi:hypothetical protein
MTKLARVTRTGTKEEVDATFAILKSLRYHWESDKLYAIGDGRFNCFLGRITKQ